MSNNTDSSITVSTDSNVNANQENTTMTTENTTVTVSAADLVRSLGIKDADLSAMAAQVTKAQAALASATAAYNSAKEAGEGQVASATALVESLRELGLNDEAIGGALAVKYASARKSPKLRMDRPSEKDGRSMKGDENAAFAAEVRASVSEYIAAADRGFTAAALTMAMLQKHGTKQVEVREYLTSLIETGEVMFNGAKGRGSCWAAPCYAASLSLFKTKEDREAASEETPATE